MLQKLPLRFFVGIEFMPLATTPVIQIAPESRSYSLQENKFKKDTLDHLAKDRLLDFVNKSFKNKFQKKPIKIHLLSEMPLGGSGSSGALTAGLATGLALASNAIAPRDIHDWAKQPSSRLIKNKKYRFDFIFRLAWKMLAAYQGDLTSGATIFTALLGSRKRKPSVAGFRILAPDDRQCLLDQSTPRRLQPDSRVSYGWRPHLTIRIGRSNRLSQSDQNFCFHWPYFCYTIFSLGDLF